MVTEEQTKYKNKNVIGADESGVGDYFTSLVAAAVFVPTENVDKLINIGVDDSKKFNNKKILELAKKIKPLVKFRTRHLTPRGYNILTASFNAHELKTFLHLTAIGQLAHIHRPDVIVLDKYVSKEKWDEYEAHLRKKNFLEIPYFSPALRRKIVFANQGETHHIAVAAASILARELVLIKLKEQSIKWNTNFPLGVSEKTIKAGRDFVKKYGFKKLFEVAKISFKTTKEIIPVK